MLTPRWISRRPLLHRFSGRGFAALLATALIGSVFTLVSGASAATAYGASVGLNPDITACNGGSLSEIANEVQFIANSGAKWIRCDMMWSSVQGSKTSWRWDYSDNLVNAARAKGLNVLLIADYTPAWARPQNTSDKYAPQGQFVDDYATFVAAAVNHFKGRVNTFEIWNEPNMSAFWQPNPNIGDYVNLLKAAAAKAHNADPKVNIISAGMAPAPNQKQFVDQVVDSALSVIDGVGVHAYSGYDMAGQNDSWNPMTAIAPEVGNKLNGTGKKIWNTEFGFSTGGRDHNGGTEQDQRDYITGKGNQKGVFDYWFQDVPNAGPLMWYQSTDQSSTDPWLANLGLRHQNGQVKPAYGAFQQAMNNTGGPPPTTTPTTRDRGTTSTSKPHNTTTTSHGHGTTPTTRTTPTTGQHGNGGSLKTWIFYPSRDGGKIVSGKNAVLGAAVAGNDSVQSVYFASKNLFALPATKTPYGYALELDTTKYPDGNYEVQSVAFANGGVMAASDPYVIKIRNHS